MGTVKYNGPMASFHCPTNAQIRSLKVHFSPKQEGTGDPSPENVRPIVGWDGVEVNHTGKNLANSQLFEKNKYISASGNIGDLNGFMITNFISVRYLHTYIYSGMDTYGAINIRVHGYDTDKNWIKQVQLNGANDKPYNYLLTINDENIKFIRISTAMDEHFQFEESSTATSYEPYRGETIDYEFGVLGKNKLDPNSCLLGTYWHSNQNRSSSSDWISVNYIPVVGGATYTITGSTVTTQTPTANHLFYDADKNLISNIPAGITNQTFTVPDNCRYVRLSIKNTSLEGLQLELGSTATTYEPYDPKHTVYGGWVDLISGEVCEEYNKITIDGENRKTTYVYESGGSYGAGYVYVSPSGKNVRYKNGIPINLWCENLPVYIGMLAVPTVPYMYAPLAGALYTIFYLASVEEHPELEDASARREYVNNWLKQNPVTIVYELATPNTYYLAPTQLQTFLGQNNVWSNADYVEVEYDLHETQNILARKQFIMAHQPHIETAASSFTTDLRAPLKSAKVYFNPIQEGSGDPSPDNIRPITGWTGLSLYHSGENLYVSNPNNKGYISSSGVIKVDTTSTYTDLIPVTVGDTYSFKCTTVNVNGETNRRMHGYDSNGNWVQQISMGKTAANTVEERTILATIPKTYSNITNSIRNSCQYSKFQE